MLKDVTEQQAKAAAAWVIPVLLGRVVSGAEKKGKTRRGAVCPRACMVLLVLIR